VMKLLCDENFIDDNIYEICDSSYSRDETL